MRQSFISMISAFIFDKEVSQGHSPRVLWYCVLLYKKCLELLNTLNTFYVFGQ